MDNLYKIYRNCKYISNYKNYIKYFQMPHCPMMITIIFKINLKRKFFLCNEFFFYLDYNYTYSFIIL